MKHSHWKFVNVKVAEPAPTAVMAPALVMVATAVLLDAQVPPVVGVMVAVPPTQIFVELKVPMVDEVSLTR